MFDESEVREFVKKMGFRPDPSGPDWEEKLVDALTGKDKSENAGWGSVYYNSDKVLQFLEKYDMLGPKGINQHQAISKLKRLLKSGKWKEDEDMRKINENQKVTLTLGQLKKLVKESEDDKNENRSYVVYYKLFNEEDKVLYLSAKSSKDAIFSALDTIKVRNHLKTRNDVFEILQSIEVKK